MSDPNDSPDQPAIPSWQRQQSNDDAAPTTSSTVDAPATKTETATTESEATVTVTEEPAKDTPDTPTESQEDKLEVARRFLDDEAVRHAPREKKVAFLQSKEIDQHHIDQLLPPDEASTASQPTSSPPSPTQTLPLAPADRPPIVTYPEFLVKPARPPPLVTTSRLINTLYAVAGLSTLVYGAGHLIINPMVNTQTEARLEYHDTTKRKLDALVAKLEKSVSEIPPAKKTALEEDSDTEDPAEMFHRDMGTQTSPLIPSVAKDGKSESPAKQHADKLASLNKSLSGITDGYRSQSEGMDKIKQAVDGLRDDLDTLTYGNQSEYIGGYDIYGGARKNEPDDEIRKVRDSIRRIKGVLLSTRTFPVSTR